jgi:hypothetical protein
VDICTTTFQIGKEDKTTIMLEIQLAKDQKEKGGGGVDY